MDAIGIDTKIYQGKSYKNIWDGFGLSMSSFPNYRTLLDTIAKSWKQKLK
jgi:hypothetical protein